MKYIGLDIGDGESAVAAFEHGSDIEPIIWPVAGARSLLSAVGLRQGEIVIGERAYTDAMAEGLSVRFKSRFTTDIASYEDVTRFVRGILCDLQEAGRLDGDECFIIGCPAGWNAPCRARYRELLIRAGLPNPRVISESRAAFLYAKYARTVALDVSLLSQSALVADMGSSTLDYAYIVDGRETGVGTFGENALGGGVLDAALLRRAVEQSPQRDAIRAVFRESRSWYSYCEIEARRVKENYFTLLAGEDAPVVTRQLRLCYDGVQRITLRLDADELEHLIGDPLPELGGFSFTAALRQSLENAARLTAGRTPALLLLTGGASRMGFFRELCQQTFPGAVVVSCPEPEFSIAKGLAYAGWVDENLRAFRKAVEEELTRERIAQMADDAMPSLLPAVADILAQLMIDEAALPVVQQWKHGGIRTLQEMEDQIAARVERVLASPLAQEALAPAVEVWMNTLTERMQAIVNPLCDRYNVPRTEMRLDLAASGAGSVALGKNHWSGLSIVGTLLGVLVSVISGLICGGGGLALVAAGPIGFLAGLAIGAAASLLGWGPLSKLLKKADLPLLMRAVPIEKRLCGEQTQHELRKRLLDTISPPHSAFRTQMADAFAKSFHTYLLAIAQAAEIPIE